MLRELHIENVAVIERANLELGPGLNILTGETGAGKSIVIDALGAVLGQRTSRELIRTGAERLGWELEKLFEQTILAMRSCESDVNSFMGTYQA